jgi:uncharacterized protein (DUF3084 family)
VFTEGDEIFARNDALREANTTLGKRNESLLKRSLDLKQSVRRIRKEVDAAKSDAKAAARDRDVALGAVASLHDEITARKLEIAAKKHELDALRKTGEAADRELAKRTAQLNEVQASLLVAQASFAKAQSRLDEANARLEETNGKLTEAENKLKAQQTELDKQQAMLENAKADLTELTKQIEKSTGSLRGGSVALRQGDEIARGTVLPGQSEFGIKGDLFALLDSASEAAKQRGAGIGPNGRTVSLIYQQILTEKLGVYNPDENACVELARRAVSESPTEVLVKVVCAINTIAGEQAPVEFELYVNNLVYSKGDLIATTKMDGRASEGRVLMSVIEFLRKDVAEAALKRGIVPVSNFDPRYQTGTDPQRQLDSLMGVVEQIRSKKSKVAVEAYACADVYASGPLNMDNIRFSVAKTK